MVIGTRNALFISHANPEDNAFTLWLGGRLTALGYTVFADILRLKGGDDWERILEDAIRDRAAKFLLAATPHGAQKQGVRNEITIASQTSRKLDDPNFIVPLRLAPFDAPLQIAHAQYIDFAAGWSVGLNELLSLLIERGVTPTASVGNAELWRAIQLRSAAKVSTDHEQLVSNWLPITDVPERMNFYDFKAGISLGRAQKAVQEATIPLVAFNRGFLSFAPFHELQDYFGPDLPLEMVAQCWTDDFLDKGWPELRIESRDTRSKFTDLVRRGIDRFFETKGLKPFEVASGRIAWWSTAEQATLKRLAFRWPDGPTGSRQIVGRSRKRGFHWHYGISCWARTAPVRHVRVANRVIFTSNGQDLLGDARRLHRMRRSFCKSWRNDRWRDLLLAFWSFIADSKDHLDIPMGDDKILRLRLPPLLFDAPFGIEAPDDKPDTIDDEEDDSADAGDAETRDDDPDELDDE